MQVGTCPPFGGTLRVEALRDCRAAAEIDTLSVAENTGTAALSELNFTQAFALEPGVVISDMAAADAVCSVIYILDGVHKRIYAARSGVAATLFLALDGEQFVAPTALLLSRDGSEIFVADWAGASIFSVALDTESVSRLVRLVGDGVPRQLRDSDAQNQVAPQLSGPTQLALYGDTGVLFTDRHPVLNTSAVRLLRTDAKNRGSVLTLAGGNARASRDGALAESLLQACWDIAYDANSNSVFVSQPLAGPTRMLRELSTRWAACDTGDAKRTEGGDSAAPRCSACVSGKHAGVQAIFLICSGSS